jgi:hypothetical protein
MPTGRCRTGSLPRRMARRLAHAMFARLPDRAVRPTHQHSQCRARTKHKCACAERVLRRSAEATEADRRRQLFRPPLAPSCSSSSPALSPSLFPIVSVPPVCLLLPPLSSGFRALSADLRLSPRSPHPASSVSSLPSYQRGANELALPPGSSISRPLVKRSALDAMLLIPFPCFTAPPAVPLLSSPPTCHCLPAPHAPPDLPRGGARAPASDTCCANRPRHTGRFLLPSWSDPACLAIACPLPNPCPRASPRAPRLPESLVAPTFPSATQPACRLTSGAAASADPACFARARDCASAPSARRPLSPWPPPKSPFPQRRQTPATPRTQPAADRALLFAEPAFLPGRPLALRSISPRTDPRSPDPPPPGATSRFPSFR